MMLYLQGLLQAHPRARVGDKTEQVPHCFTNTQTLKDAAPLGQLSWSLPERL